LEQLISDDSLSHHQLKSGDHPAIRPKQKMIFSEAVLDP
jgi:hypothetical protein